MSDAVILTAGDKTIIITPREMHIALRGIIPGERGEAQRRLMLDGEIRLMKTAEGMRLVPRVAGSETNSLTGETNPIESETKQ